MSVAKLKDKTLSCGRGAHSGDSAGLCGKSRCKYCGLIWYHHNPKEFCPLWELECGFLGGDWFDTDEIEKRMQ